MEKIPLTASADSFAFAEYGGACVGAPLQMEEARVPDGLTLRRSQTMRGVPENVADRLIVALDVPSAREAQDLVRRLDGVVSFFKIGLGLFFSEGVEALIDNLVHAQKNVFLDYKMYDIGQTVKNGVERAKQRGIKFVTVHGDKEIMQAAVEGRGDSSFLKVFSITVLTSLDDAALRDMGYALTVEQLVERRVRGAIECGCDGIIASPLDRPDEIRKLSEHDGLLIATPGIRPSGHGANDHKRQATPAEAIMNGADYLIVGRPIIAVADPVRAAGAIIAEMLAADSERRQSRPRG
ncbi:MAG: orotidine-5'-phosphate decarboxylase [Acetobacteraceae bacterium]